jgi:DNA-binding CsgD family transcriptional regulator
MSDKDSFINISQVASNISANVFWQDKEGKYLGCNTNLVALLASSIPDIHTEADIIGKTVRDLLPAEYAKEPFRADKAVIETGIEKIIEEAGFNATGDTAYFLSKKTPLYNADGEVTGLLGIAFDVTDYKKMSEYLGQLNNLNNEKLKNIAASVKSEKYISLPKLLRENQIDRFYLVGTCENVYLTKREAECVFHLAKGQTAKQIGKTLGLSPRTVETYLAKTKEKLKCHTVTELISKLIPFLKDL